MTNLKHRLLTIAALILASVYMLWPREVLVRTLQPDGSYALQPVRRLPIKLGLDLSGGMHMALEVDESRGAVVDKAEAIERALTVVRERIDEFGVAEPVVQRVGDDRIIVELPGIDDQERALAVVQRSAFLQFQITDETQSLDRVAPRIDAIVRDRGLAAATATPAANVRADSARRGIEGLFGATDSAQRAAGDSTAGDTAQLQLGQNVGPFSKLLQQGGTPGEYLVAREDVQQMRQFLDAPEVRDALPPGKVLRWSGDSVIVSGRQYVGLYVLDARPLITGEYLTDAQPRQDPIEGTIVSFKLNREGGRRFRNETGRHVGDYMAIVLDDRVMGRPPVIRDAIGTDGQITMGGRDLQSAQDLALVLRAGALPVPLRVAEIRNIGASLGQDSIRQGVRALIVAIALIVIIMVVYYRFSGVLAVAGLGLWVLWTGAALAGFGAALTLPGLAGFVLSVGMCVDNNVLIFERIREELVRGKTVRTAIDEGFRHALSAIVDTSVTSILTAAILYQFGTGPIRGFAVTLIAGILGALLTTIFVVRTFFLLWLSRARKVQTLSI